MIRRIALVLIVASALTIAGSSIGSQQTSQLARGSTVQVVDSANSLIQIQEVGDCRIEITNHFQTPLDVEVIHPGEVVQEPGSLGPGETGTVEVNESSPTIDLYLTDGDTTSVRLEEVAVPCSAGN